MSCELNVRVTPKNRYESNKIYNASQEDNLHPSTGFHNDIWISFLYPNDDDVLYCIQKTSKRLKQIFVTSNVEATYEITISGKVL